jgi:hypothetical protein
MTNRKGSGGYMKGAVGAHRKKRAMSSVHCSVLAKPALFYRSIVGLQYCAIGSVQACRALWLGYCGIL